MDQNTQEMVNSKPNPRRWGLIFSALLATVAFSLFTWTQSNVENEKQARLVEACNRQHSIIEMQRLFLREHANIRILLAGAGVHHKPHPELLEDLNRLIEEADCVVGVDVEGGE